MLPGLTQQEARDLIMSVGTHHGNRILSPFEVAELFRKAITAGATPIDCAHFVSLAGSTMITKFLRLLKLTQEIRHIVDWGQTGATIAFTAAWHLADLNEFEQETVAREILANQMKWKEVHQVIQLKKCSPQRIEECVSEVLRMRPVITRRHIFLGAVTDERVKKSLAQLKQYERDVLLQSAIKEFYGNLSNTSVKLGTERFTIVTDELGAARLKQGEASGFEVAINRSIAAKVPNA
jgi:hypothetical protein